MTPENHRKPWSEKEIQKLRDLYAVCDREEVAKTLGRTVKAVTNKAYKLDISPTRHFSDDELDEIRSWYREREGQPLELGQLSANLGRSKSTVCRKARQIGLTDQRRLATKGLERHEDGRYYVRNEEGRVVGTRKYPTMEAALEAIGRSTAQRIEENGHPKGFEGHSHTKEAREKISEAHKERYENISEEERSRVALRAVETRIERYGTAGPVNVSNPYSRTNSGKREDLDGQFFRSSWEANYARFLNWLIENGGIESWEYEADEFWFEGIKRGTRSYTPDFKVTQPDGSIEYHEVKGWMDQKSRTKLGRMERYHPDVEVVLIGNDAYREIREKVSGMIEGWETNDL